MRSVELLAIRCHDHVGRVVPEHAGGVGGGASGQVADAAGEYQVARPVNPEVADYVALLRGGVELLCRPQSPPRLPHRPAAPGGKVGVQEAEVIRPMQPANVRLPAASIVRSG